MVRFWVLQFVYVCLIFTVFKLIYCSCLRCRELYLLVFLDKREGRWDGAPWWLEAEEGRNDGQAAFGDFFPLLLLFFFVDDDIILKLELCFLSLECWRWWLWNVSETCCCYYSPDDWTETCDCSFLKLWMLMRCMLWNSFPLSLSLNVDEDNSSETVFWNDW